MTSSDTPPRRLVLVDIENLLATPSPTEQQVARFRERLVHHLGDQSNTLLEIACSHHGAAEVRFGFPDGHHRWRSGMNGADTVLLDVLETERVVERFEEVVIVSGDGIFTDAVTALSGQGIRCIVIGRAGGTASRLRMAAHYTILLSDDDEERSVPRTFWPETGSSAGDCA